MNSDALPVIDLRHFSQSELLALSKASMTSVGASSRYGELDDVPLPKIDRAVFNESAGSRRQTYSRLRLTPRETNRGVEEKSAEVEVDIGAVRRKRGRPRKDNDSAEKAEMDDQENSRIVGMLKELFLEEETKEVLAFEDLVEVDIEFDPELNFENAELVTNPVQVDIREVSPVMRKRGRPTKDSAANVSLNEIVVCDNKDSDGDSDDFGVETSQREDDDNKLRNENGEEVDVGGSENTEDPFDHEAEDGSRSL